MADITPDFSAMSDEDLNKFIQTRQAPSSSATDLSGMSDEQLQAHISGLQGQVKQEGYIKRAATDEGQQFGWAGAAAPYLKSFMAANPAENIPLGSWGVNAATAAAGAAAGQGEGATYSERYNDLRAKQEAARQVETYRHPVASAVGAIGTVPLLPSFGAEKVGPMVARAVERFAGPGTLSRAAGLAGDIAGGGALAAGYGAATGIEQGDTTEDRIKNALASAKEAVTAGPSIGPVKIPLVAGIPVGGRLIGAGLEKFTGAKTGDQAAQRVRAAMEADAAAKAKLQGVSPKSPALGMSAEDIQAAQQAGQPWVVGDIGGAQTRMLARTVKNLSPEAGAYLETPLESRFQIQGSRLADYMRNAIGVSDGTGAADVRDALTRMSRVENKDAYSKAYSQPAAQSMWDNDFSQLMQAPVVQNSIEDAVNLGKNISAAAGHPTVENPFIKDANGNWTLKVNPDGSTATPNLQFWDYVKQSLDDKVNAAYSNQANKLGNAYKDVRDTLREKLDTAVPEYNQARAGAAKFFGAQDAHEAGTNFLRNMNAYNTDDAMNAFKKMSSADQKLFGMGMSSDIINRASNMNDSSNVARMFNSPSSRQKLAMGLGEDQAAALEAYIRRESMMNMLKTAVGGNSSTAAQLLAAEMFGGIEAGKAAWENRDEIMKHPVLSALGLGGTVLTGAILKYNHGVDQTLAPRIAQLIASSNPADFERILNASQSSQNIRNIIRRTEMGMAAAYGAKQGQKPQEEVPNEASGGRIGRATGGRAITPEDEAERLVTAAETAKKQVNKTTEPLLDVPDDHIVKALDVAQAAI
jgi:hypothetical protein